VLLSLVSVIEVLQFHTTVTANDGNIHRIKTKFSLKSEGYW